MTIPSSDEWSFAEFDVARRAYLDRDMAFDEMAKRIADLAVINTGCIDPLRTENPEAPVDTTWRAWFTISVADEPCLSDLFYNGRDGVRGRYYIERFLNAIKTAFDEPLPNSLTRGKFVVLHYAGPMR